MHITFHGAVREVTGSMHLLAVGDDRILLDCGMFQGRRKESAAKNRHFPLDARAITNLILSHAHIDHSGRIPLLTKNGFNGRIVCTRVTADACAYLLPDSAHIQESDALYLNYKALRAAMIKQRGSGSGGKKKKHTDPAKILKTAGHRLNAEKIDELIGTYRVDAVQPLYTAADAQHALSFFDGYPFYHPVTVGRDVTCTLYPAGHILGSAVCMITARENGRDMTLCYTGDIGRFDKPIIKDPARDFDPAHRNVDLMIMESTYGGRIHEPQKNLKPGLRDVLNETFDRGGSVIIPAFAYGRTQELLYVLHELYDSGEVPRVPVFVDSPLATNITRVFGEHPEVYDAETHAAFLEKGKNPFRFDQMQFVASVEDSMALNREKKPHIVIAASGMCEAGRVLHHLRHKIHNPKHTILIVGFMARHTLGRRILEKGSQYEADGRKGDAPVVRLLNKEYPLRARVRKLGGFSAHGDRNDMLRFLRDARLNVKQIALVHGEEDQCLAFADFLKQEGYAVCVPSAGEKVTI